jgi:two-component system NtrC family sensor kinase
VAFKSKENICLQIEDNGQGINAQDLPKIFDPFFTTKEPGKGTGLGLSICYGIMQKLGGKIEVESHPGEGTSVTLYFPLATKSLVTISRPKDDL